MTTRLTPRLGSHSSTTALLVALALAGCGGARGGVLAGKDGGGDDAQSPPAAADLGQPADLAMVPDAATTVVSGDAFSAVRTACINEINRLRAMQSLAPYTLVNTDTINSCVDAQATSDEQSGQAHMAWIAAEGSVCDGNGQDECEGGATSVAGIIGCLDSMWAEQNQPNCAGCVGCTAFGGACPNCDFYGSQGGECGHYVNMSATYFAKVACGFSTNGDWAVQNFYQ
ncbi:MAG: hypothetical protein ABI321_11360 [Polyangia bacterium]